MTECRNCGAPATLAADASGRWRVCGDCLKPDRAQDEDDPRVCRCPATAQLRTAQALEHILRNGIPR